MNPHDPSEPQVPHRLERALRDAYPGPGYPGPDAAFDREMLAMGARVGVGASNRRLKSHRRLRRNLLTGLAAAVCAGTITAWFMWPGHRAQTAPVASLAAANPRDLNGDGRIDMLDALLLAERVESGSAAKQLDLNADGTVDTRDASALAADAVNLQRGTL